MSEIEQQRLEEIERRHGRGKTEGDETVRDLAKEVVRLQARCAELADQRRAMVRAAVLRDDENAALKAAARAFMGALRHYVGEETSDRLDDTREAETLRGLL